jgi:hypothetical protein
LRVRDEGEWFKGTHDEVARVREEELADLETLWPEIGVEPGRELVVARGPLRCGPDGELV